MKRILIAVSAALLATGTAFAQSTVVVTPDSSEPSGSTVVIPGEVRHMATEQEVPSATYEGDVVVGSELPSSVEIHRISSNDAYSYSIINEKRVIVDPHTHKIIEIVQ